MHLICLYSELSASLNDVKLCELVTKNVIKTIKMIAVKAEQLIISDGEASQVIGPPTAAQKTNASLVNVLHQFDRHLRRSLVSPDLLREELRLVANRCLDLFVRHSSLLRPLGDGGKMKLAADFAQVNNRLQCFIISHFLILILMPGLRWSWL